MSMMPFTCYELKRPLMTRSWSIFCEYIEKEGCEEWATSLLTKLWTWVVA